VVDSLVKRGREGETEGGMVVENLRLFLHLPPPLPTDEFSFV
jgi:hypothetical protein